MGCCENVTISCVTFVMLCLQRGEKMTTKEVQEIIDEVDENKDGKLDYKEVRF